LVAAALVMVARRPAVAPVAADAHVQG